MPTIFLTGFKDQLSKLGYFVITCTCVVSHMPLYCTVLSLSQLGNGVSVATEAGGGQVASLTVSVGVGSRYETSENNGCCSVLGAAAFKVRCKAKISSTHCLIFVCRIIIVVAVAMLRLLLSRL